MHFVYGLIVGFVLAVPIAVFTAAFCIAARRNEEGR